MKNNITFESLDEFAAHLQFERRLSINTIKSYKFDLNKYFLFLHDINNPSRLEEALLVAQCYPNIIMKIPL